MSNLGGYQTLTALAKKVGGPGKLVALIAGGGVLIGGIAVKGGELVIKKAIAKNKEKNGASLEKNQIRYTVQQDGESNEGLEFKVGDKFKVLDSDGDAILIELIGNKNNPYFVSKDLLEQTSDFNENGGI
ncbi:MAG: hypothetical protein RR399_09220 [Lachnospiraceae bacterium]